MSEDARDPASDLADLRDDLERVGDKELRKALLHAIGEATKPAPGMVRGGIRTAIPHHGGLSRLVEETSLITRRTYLDRHEPVVEVRLRNVRLDVFALDHGILRHPLFGNKKRWFTQHIDPAWFEESLEPIRDHVIDHIEEAIDQVEEVLAGKED